ncbi:MAG TPA: hypothetical protein GX506_03795, partial [Firmicutes bacterium]|nr:hypothetical protein [Bacillota bacterium]
HGNPGAGVIAAMLSALALGTGLLARWLRARTAREERIRAERIERLRVRLNDSKQEFAGFVSDLWPLYCTVEESARAPELCGRADCSADFSALKEVLESVERALSGEPYDLTEAAKSLKWLGDEISRLRHNEEAYLQFRRNEEVDALISNLERERDQAIGDRREIENERKKLEVSSRLAELALQESALRAQLAQMVREWRINALAQGLLREALSEYERTRQPAVLEIASNNFRTITQGRYDRVVQSGGGAFEVVTSGGERLGVEALSRGTQEQLYLSLRLGLALDFARRAVFLPLIMDDVLVDFDPGRARATASLLASLSGELQVLFFTCHPDTAGLISATVPGSRVILMDYGARPDP